MTVTIDVGLVLIAIGKFILGIALFVLILEVVVGYFYHKAAHSYQDKDKEVK